MESENKIEEIIPKTRGRKRKILLEEKKDEEKEEEEEYKSDEDDSDQDKDNTIRRLKKNLKFLNQSKDGRKKNIFVVESDDEINVVKANKKSDKPLSFKKIHKKTANIDLSNEESENENIKKKEIVKKINKRGRKPLSSLKMKHSENESNDEISENFEIEIQKNKKRGRKPLNNRKSKERGDEDDIKIEKKIKKNEKSIKENKEKLNFKKGAYNNLIDKINESNPQLDSSSNKINFDCCVKCTNKEVLNFI